jgi:hypothetical protein
MIATQEAKQVLVMRQSICSICKTTIECNGKAWCYLCEPCAEALPGRGNVWLMAHLHCYKPAAQ